MHPLLLDPISNNYAQPPSFFVKTIQQQNAAVNCDIPGKIKALHCYESMGLKGSLSQMMAREAVINQLLSALDLLGPGYEFQVFDAFRTKETQLALFEMIYANQKALRPTLSDEELMTVTRQFVAHPDETGRFGVPPHNSGGAVDLCLAYQGNTLDFGTDFDEVSPLSKTDYFEQRWQADFGITEERWLLIRHNRRLLFNALKLNGFVNYDEEWWHYDLGDCIWAQTLGIDWHYPSMEQDVEVH